MIFSVFAKQPLSFEARPKKHKSSLWPAEASERKSKKTK
jgi:hypothetical protein